ncbi:MAG: phospho-N-acetylmuramoyl-pentapeptide-transferase, partial [Phycisphaerales bacterium]|nr:phospho-N-acetylmuramoyl-pentapeptide-transferase [Phycisphaerales bacterium]
MLYNFLQSKDVQQWLDNVGAERFLQVLHQLEFRAFFAVVVSFLIVLFFGKRTIRWLLRRKIGDAPEFYNADLNELMASKAATPTMGGVLICASILATTLLLADLRSTYVHIGMLVLLVLACLGGFDDWLKLTSASRKERTREGLLAWEKLLFQLGIGVVAGYFMFKQGEGDTAHVLVLPFQRTYVPGTFQLETSVLVLGGFAYVFLAAFLIAGTSNAVNLTDGMDGLAAGSMAVAAFAVMVLCYVAGHDEAAKELMFPALPATKDLMVIAGAMAGACLGFLWFNCMPARVFMGDTGSLPLGGLLAYIAVAIRQEVLLLVIGALFYSEMLSVVMQVGYFKLTKGKRIFRMAPLHHHFEMLGWEQITVVIRFWII